MLLNIFPKNKCSVDLPGVPLPFLFEILLVWPLRYLVLKSSPSLL